VNEDGHVFRLTSSDFASDEPAAKFQKSPTVTLNLPLGLDAPLGAIALKDGSLFAYCGGKEPKAWFITPNAQLGRGLSIPSGPQTKPVAIAGGIVLPLEGRLSFLPLQSSGPKVDDYTRPLNPNASAGQKPPEWMHLEALDDTQFLAVDSAGALMRFQYRTDPRPHLFEVRNLPLKSAVNVPFAVSEGVVVFADAARELHVMDGQSFQILGSAPLEGDATNAIWMAGGKVYVETNRSQLHAYEIAPQPKKLWTLSLENSGLAGSPVLVGPMLFVAKQNGDVLLVDPQTGTVSDRHSTGQPLVATPFAFGNHLLAPSLDGSLYSLESVLASGGR
jgi:hypothetical protein